jgi:cellobiose transport system permease protein
MQTRNEAIGVKKYSVSKLLLYLFLIVGALISLFPIWWMFVIATNPSHVVNQLPPAFFPGN